MEGKEGRALQRKSSKNEVQKAIVCSGKYRGEGGRILGGCIVEAFLPHRRGEAVKTEFKPLRDVVRWLGKVEGGVDRS